MGHKIHEQLSVILVSLCGNKNTQQEYNENFKNNKNTVVISRTRTITTGPVTSYGVT